MKKVLGVLGKGLFWLLWPALYVYFKTNPERSRVLVVAGGEEFLAVRPWLGTGKYLLPGGGKKRDEPTLTSAVRELREETGIDVPESSLVRLGRRRHSQSGLSYNADFYVLELADKPGLQPEGKEILDACWVRMDDFGNLPMTREVTHAIRRYKPLKQAELL